MHIDPALETLRHRLLDPIAQRFGDAAQVAVEALGALRARLERHLIGRALLRTLAERDTATADYCTRVASIAELIAVRLGVSDPARREHLRLACLLHDLGKVHVPLEVLHKPGALDDEEWLLMRAHAPDGERIVAASLSTEVARIVGQHHERMDGRGYPLGLEAAAICLEARIVAVADAFDADSHRPYRRALEPTEALTELRRAAGIAEGDGGQFDPDVVRALEARFVDVVRLCKRFGRSLLKVSDSFTRPALQLT